MSSETASTDFLLYDTDPFPPGSYTMDNISLVDLMAVLKHLNDDQLEELKSMLKPEAEEDLQTWLNNQNGGDVNKDGGSAGAYTSGLMQYRAYRAHKGLLLYIPPFIILLGTFGNIFSFIILRRKAMLKFSTYFYLMVLAVADTLVLYVGLLPNWMSELGFDIRSQSDWVCKVFTLVFYTISDFSVWLIIAVTVERYIVVCHPLKANRLCNTRAARNVIIVLLFVLCLVNLHFLWTVEVRTFIHKGEEVNVCDSVRKHEYLIDGIWPWVDALLYCFAPFVVIMCLNGRIINQVMLAKRLRLEMRGGDYEQRRPSHEGSTRLTVMLLTISFAFLALTLPKNIVGIITDFYDQYKKDLSRVAYFHLYKTITELLMYTNHSINFFLYCATGQKFRHQLIWMMCYAKKTYNLTWGSDESRAGRGDSKSGYPSIVSKSMLMRNRTELNRPDINANGKQEMALLPFSIGMTKKQRFNTNMV